jgi:hypothetical protein
MAAQSGPFNTGIDLTTITNQIDTISTYASDAYNTANGFLTNLSTAIGNYNIPDTTSSIIFDTSGINRPMNFDKPSAPIAPDITLSLPTFPSFPSIDIPSLDLGSLGVAPEFTDSEPNINDVVPPNPFSENAPDKPETASFTFPDVYNPSFPELPGLQQITLPEVPALEFEFFSANLPENTINPAEITFNWSEDPFSNEVITATTNALLNRLQGGTGLSPTVERAIWDRARAREEINSVRSKQQQLIEFAQSGFKRPQGSHFAALDFFMQETQNKIADLSREIAIKQAELEQSNLQYIIKTIIAHEELLYRIYQDRITRQFDSLKYTQDVAIEVFKAQLQSLGLNIEIYKAYTIAFEAKLKKQLALIDTYKTEVEAQQLVGTINEQTIKVYLGELDGLKTGADIYKTNVQAIAEQIQAEALKIQSFKTEVEAYSAKVEAKKAEYSGYAERVRGELGKASVYETKAKAYAAKIEGYASKAKAITSVSEFNVEKSKTYLQAYQAQLDSILKAVQAQSASNQAALSLYEGQARMFSAEVGAEAARFDSDIKTIEEIIQANRARADVALKNAEINITNAYQAANLHVEAEKAGASVAAQIAAGSLAALNIGAHMSYNGSVSDSYSESNDVT